MPLASFNKMIARRVRRSDQAVSVRADAALAPRGRSRSVWLRTRGRVRVDWRIALLVLGLLALTVVTFRLGRYLLTYVHWDTEDLLDQHLHHRPGTKR